MKITLKGLRVWAKMRGKFSPKRTNTNPPHQRNATNNHWEITFSIIRGTGDGTQRKDFKPTLSSVREKISMLHPK